MAHWIVAAIVVLLFALAFQLPLLAYAMYALLGVLLLSRYVTRVWTVSLRAEREIDREKVDVGDTISVVIRLGNDGGLPIVWCLVEDLLPRAALIHDPPSLGVVGRRAQLSTLPARATRELRYQIRCNRRGYFQIGPAVVETGDLFGLHRRYRVLAEPHFLLVYPKVVPIQGYAISSRRPIGEVRMTYRLFEDPSRISGVRRYESGDPFNRVHWRATARAGALHSKAYEPSTVAGATILLEHHHESHDPRNEPVRSELAITAAASLANSVYEMGQQVGLVTNGRDAADRIRLQGWDLEMRSRDAAREAAEMLPASERLQPVVVETRRGADQLIRILETLARVELTDGLTLPQLLAECTSRMPRDATVVVITPVVTEEQVVALAHLRRLGFAVSVILNLWDEYDFAQASGPLLAAGIETHHLKEEASIPAMCRGAALRVQG